ncbi:hypothetical protein [Phorcysia thermohydrogeniphila]|nr:hypothetical protein [Phorcysia thermohydrogeniphila]
MEKVRGGLESMFPELNLRASRENSSLRLDDRSFILYNTPKLGGILREEV